MSTEKPPLGGVSGEAALPERPEKPSPHAHMVEHAQYWMRLSDFYRARTEALVEYAQDLRCEYVHHKPKDYHGAGEPCPAMVRLHELLSACARKEAGR